MGDLVYHNGIPRPAVLYALNESRTNRGRIADRRQGLRGSWLDYVDIYGDNHSMM